MTDPNILPPADEEARLIHACGTYAKQLRTAPQRAGRLVAVERLRSAVESLLVMYGMLKEE